jgi:hypothetical protein
MNRKENVLVKKSFAFSKRIVKLYQFLNQEKRDFYSVKANLEKWHIDWSKCSRSKWCNFKSRFLGKDFYCIQGIVRNKILAFSSL